MKTILFTIIVFSAAFSLFFVDDASAVSMSTDKDVYTWTDKIHIRVVTPGWTPERYAVGSETQEGHFIKITTSQQSNEPYKLNKAGNTLYTGEITLTGFLHDVDGDGKPDTNPRTSGSGSNGFLEIQPDEKIKLLLQIPGGESETHTVFVNWNKGEITLDKQTYKIDSFATIQITDPDMNLNPETLDKINVIVTSGSDVTGITVNAIETNENSGVFVATISFTQNNPSHGTRLHALPNDMIFAKYIDRTLPKPYLIHDELEIEIESQVVAPIPEPYDGENLEEPFCGKGATYVDGICIEENTEPDTTNGKWDDAKLVLAPLKQIKSGIDPFLVQCNNNMFLMLKPMEFTQAVCVTESTMEKLADRDWRPIIIVDAQ